MANDFDDIRRRLNRTFPNATPEQALQRARAIVGTTRLPDNAEGGLAKAGLVALQQGDEPTPKQLAALELMLRIMRPAPKFINHVPEDLEPDFLALFPSWPHFRSAVEPFARSIGRIDRVGDNKPIGTGFLVRPDLIVTNRHVLDAVSMGTGTLERGQAVILFGKEFTTPDEDPLQIVGVRRAHETLDIALLEVEPWNQPPLTISASAPMEGTAVVAIGFPYDDSERNPLFIGTIFGRRFGVKRAAPGDVVRTSPARHLWQHDCSTLGGNSGSPLLSLATVEVVGLHFGGSFLWRNEAVDAPALATFVSQYA